jgi:hypothetical protein
VADHSSDGRPFPGDSVPRTPSAERPITPPPPETEANTEGEQPASRPREPPTPRVEEQVEDRPTIPQDNEGESAGSEAFRNNTECWQSPQPEGCHGCSNPGTNRPSASRTRPPLKNLGEGLLGDPMAAVMALILEGFVGEAGATSLERFAGGLMHAHYQVRFCLRFLCS